MQQLLAMILLCSLISPIHSMNNKKTRLYPMLDVTEARPLIVSAQSEHPHGPPPPYSLFDPNSVSPSQAYAAPQIYLPTHITMQESEEELKSLCKLLTQEKETLTSLRRRFRTELTYLNRQRCIENIQSNATVGGIGFGYYMTIFILQICGDPRLSENNGNNWSIAPVTHNIFGWIGSQCYAMSQCSCRKIEPDYNNE